VRNYETENWGKKKVARDFNNKSNRRIDGTPERRRQAVLMRRERGPR
jgi:hypothetical protein